MFTALASAAGDPAGPRTITAGDGTLDPELEEAAAALEEGQCSGILETDEGFSILRRLSTDSRELAGAWFDVQLQNAAADISVETGERYDQLNPAEFDACFGAAAGGVGTGGISPGKRGLRHLDEKRGCFVKDLTNFQNSQRFTLTQAGKATIIKIVRRQSSQFVKNLANMLRA